MQLTCVPEISQVCAEHLEPLENTPLIAYEPELRTRTRLNLIIFAELKK